MNEQEYRLRVLASLRVIAEELRALRLDNLGQTPDVHATRNGVADRIADVVQGLRDLYGVHESDES